MNSWELLNSYFRGKNIAQMEIDSYNQFINKKLPEIIEENKLISPKIEEVRIEIENIKVDKPRIIEADGSPRATFFPMEARIRNRTYSGPIYLKMRLYRRDVEQDVRNAYIGELPVMLKSNKCWLEGKTKEELTEMGEDPMDFGGYFIINGSEKALMTQEVLASDRVLISEQLQDTIAAEVISTRGAFKGKVRIIRKNDGMLYVTFPASPRKLRLFVLLRALGMKNEKEMKDAFSEEIEIENDVLLNLENLNVKKEEEALDKIGRFVAPGQVEEYRLRRAQEVIDAFLLPHIGQEPKDRIAKAYYLIMMATKAIERAYKLRGKDDKDHYANKRLELSGKLMEHLFRYSFKYFIKDLKFHIDRTVTRRRKLNISTVVRPGAISERIRFAMSTGNWIGRATGVSKFMDRVNYLSPLTDLRKVKSPLDKNRELYEARDVHGTHWGRLDSIETPDGPQCVASDTEMILSDYTGITIKDFENEHERILSVDWEKDKSEKTANVVRYIKPGKAKAYKVKTKETGRTIVATADHPFYTENGKINLSQIKKGSKVAVLPILPIKHKKLDGKVIITEEDVIRNCSEKSNVKYVVEELKNMGFLPLKDNDKRVLSLVRLLGHMFGDGSLTLSMKKYKSNTALVFSGTEGDLKEIGREIRELGFNISKITKSHKTSVLSDGRVISGTTTRADCYAKPLWVLLKALGAPEGDKAIKEIKLPEWLKNSENLIAREFLASYFGSEMTKPCIDERFGKTFLQPVFSLNKSRELVSNGIEFAADIQKLLQRFDVNISKIVVANGIKRKSGLKTKKIKVKLSGKLENLINLYGRIGFNYCAERRSLARLTLGYLLTRKKLLEERLNVQKLVLKLHNNGKDYESIAESVGNSVREHDIKNWVRKNKIGVNSSEIDMPKFNDWIREHCISENGLIWESIDSIEETECNDVRDITTLQDYHNFFANGFLTGNCGLVKNLSLLAEVTTEAEEEPVEKLLKGMGVKLK